MDNNKETGSYYTPHKLISFMIDYLVNNNQNFANVLEPSAGDGRFLSKLLPISEHVKAIEVFEDKVLQINDNYLCDKLVVEQRNFLEYALKTQERFSLIVGNPPYISPKVMKAEDLDIAKKICTSENIDKSVMQNMWLAFVVGSSRILEKNGTIFFVLPTEFLQVQYAEKLRMELENRFNTIHIIGFEEPIFPEIEQDVCLVYMKNEKNGTAHITYEVYRNTTEKKALFNNTIKKNKPLKKWSNAILKDEDIILLKEKTAKYRKVEQLGISAPGIVTGGNKFFILSGKDVDKYHCEKYVIPILQKSSYISNNTITIDDNMWKNLAKKNKPMYLLDLENYELQDLPNELVKYLECIKDEEVGGQKLIQRFKCANRKPWYGVPIVNKGDIVFFKRYHKVPRVYINQINIHTTDAGYHIRLNEGIDKESAVFCFYNSLTLAQCEFEGRYYGGGVSELVPSEFKQLVIPYRDIDRAEVDKLNQLFQDKVDLEKIVAYVNEKTICLDMNIDEVKKIEYIRRRLIERRIGKNIEDQLNT